MAHYITTQKSEGDAQEKQTWKVGIQVFFKSLICDGLTLSLPGVIIL